MRVEDLNLTPQYSLSSLKPQVSGLSENNNGSQVVIDIMQESFKVSLFLAMPPLLAGLVVGVIVSIFQSVTSIQEQTLVFVPKMIAVMITLIIAFSWMLNMAINFTTRLFQDIPSFIK